MIRQSSLVLIYELILPDVRLEMKPKAMEIKRRLEKVVITNRRFTVREQESGKNIHCPDCRSGMLNAEKTSVLFEIKQREIFRIIEEEMIHFAETEGNGVMVCLSSLAKFLDSRALNRQSDNSVLNFLRDTHDAR